MAFVPHQKFKVGDLVVLTRDVTTMQGVFQVGSLVKLTGYDRVSQRGWSFIDNQGNRATEVPSSNFRETCL